MPLLSLLVMPLLLELFRLLPLPALPPLLPPLFRSLVLRTRMSWHRMRLSLLPEASMELLHASVPTRESCPVISRTTLAVTTS